MFKNGRPLLPLILAIVGLFAIAAGLSNLNLRPGEPTINLFQLLLQGLSAIRPQGAAPEALPGGDSFLWFVRLLIWFALPAALIYAFISSKFRKRLLSTLALTFLITLLLERIGSLNPREGREVEEGAASGALGGAGGTLPPPPEIVASPPAWLTAVVTLGLALLIVGAIGLVWRRLRSLKPDARSELVGAAEQALAALDRGVDVRDAVLRYYADMILHFGATRKLRRREGMTPREFDVHLAAVGIDDEHIHRLTRLFESVRYGGQVSDEPMVREARACLRSIVSTYGG
ncbi:MAG: DUF4129 domain-containing protein [Truepera sp.]|nr:DUF4129 domain-containing protein [Truepera sp.]